MSIRSIPVSPVHARVREHSPAGGPFTRGLATGTAKFTAGPTWSSITPGSEFSEYAHPSSGEIFTGRLTAIQPGVPRVTSGRLLSVKPVAGSLSVYGQKALIVDAPQPNPGAPITHFDSIGSLLYWVDTVVVEVTGVEWQPANWFLNGSTSSINVAALGGYYTPSTGQFTPLGSYSGGEYAVKIAAHAGAAAAFNVGRGNIPVPAGSRLAAAVTVTQANDGLPEFAEVYPFTVYVAVTALPPGRQAPMSFLQSAPSSDELQEHLL